MIMTENAQITPQLRNKTQWVVWCLEDKKGRLTKVPYNAQNGRLASSTNSTQWKSFDTATRAAQFGYSISGKKYDGIGFVFNNDFTGIDLDHCVNDDGTIDAWASEWITLFNSYAEYSPSKQGIHIYVQGLLPEITNKKGITIRPGKKIVLKDERHPQAAIEMYCSGRFFTVTGNHLEGTPETIEPNQEAIDLLYKRMLDKNIPPKKNIAPKPGIGPDDLTDAELLEKAKNATNGTDFQALWAGDIRAYNGDHSSADLALCNYLAFWTGKNALRMDRLFRQSDLYRDDKWDRAARAGETYGQGTIARAIDECRETYTGTKIPTGTDFKNILGAKANNNGLPDIIIGRQLREMSNDALAALVETQQTRHTIFVQSSQLKRIGIELGQPIIQAIGDPEMANLLSRAANFYRLREKQGEYILVDVEPPKGVVKDILSHKPEDWPFPPLVAIVQTPVMRPDGTILDKPGYDPATCLFYLPAEGIVFPKIMPSPTKEDVTRSVDFVSGFLQDFPFEHTADRTNAIATGISIVTRQMFRHVPAGIITANKQGTGKGMLNDFFSILATGEATDAISEIEDNEEWNKTLTSLLIEGSTFITIDNVEGVVRSPILAKILTSEYHKGRILGTSKTARVPQRAIWLINGNNVQLGGDLPRRSYMMRMITPTSTPWKRNDDQFRYPDLIGSTKKYRGEIIAALLTIARAWFTNGQPPAPGLDNMATFSDWAKTIGGMLTHAGVQGFLQNQPSENGEIDVDGSAWARFLEYWHTHYGEEDLKTADIVTKLQENAEFAETLPEPLSTYWLKEDKSFKNKLGKQLAKKNKTPFGADNLRLIQGEDTHNKVATFCVKPQKIENFAGYAGYADKNLPPTHGENFEKNTKIYTDLSSEKISIDTEGNFLPHIPHTPQIEYEYKREI